jgi:pimeloyl-ACP methyl ester carboxylesterase
MMGSAKMTDSIAKDYSILDRPDILQCIFHPRPDYNSGSGSPPAYDVPIPVEGGIAIGSRLHLTAADAPTVLFFHGNGEIVADYDDLGPLYNQMGINFWVVDYRGYGRSGGTPTVSAMMHDAHQIFTFVDQWIKNKGYKGPLIVMGRSLGSASALELAAAFFDPIDALIIESGFAFAGPLLELLGVNIAAIGFKEENGFDNIDKIATFTKPTLIIHAEFDHIIPFTDGEALFEASPAADKTLLKIPEANHNDIFMRGLSEYLKAIEGLMNRL